MPIQKQVEKCSRKQTTKYYPEPSPKRKTNPVNQSSEELVYKKGKYIKFDSYSENKFIHYQNQFLL
jgi:hypothetical protein